VQPYLKKRLEVSSLRKSI